MTSLRIDPPFFAVNYKRVWALTWENACTIVHTGMGVLVYMYLSVVYEYTSCMSVPLTVCHIRITLTWENTCTIVHTGMGVHVYVSVVRVYMCMSVPFVTSVSRLLGRIHVPYGTYRMGVLVCSTSICLCHL